MAIFSKTHLFSPAVAIPIYKSFHPTNLTFRLRNLNNLQTKKGHILYPFFLKSSTEIIFNSHKNHKSVFFPTAISCFFNSGNAVCTVSQTTSRLISKYPWAMRLRIPRIALQGTLGFAAAKSP